MSEKRGSELVKICQDFLEICEELSGFVKIRQRFSDEQFRIQFQFPKFRNVGISRNMGSFQDGQI